MAANEALNALSTTDGSNTPSGTDVIGGTLDDEVRSNKANIARSARWEHTTTASATVKLPTTRLHKVTPVDTGGGTVTISLSAAASLGDGWVTTLINVGASDVLIDASTTETIDGSVTYSLKSLYESATLVCDGSNWHVASSGKGTSLPALTVSGASTLSGAVVMTTTANVVGALKADDTLTVSGAAVFLTTTNTTGKATFVDAAFDGDVSFSGSVVMSSTLDVSGTAAVGALTVAGAALVTGPTLLTPQATTSGTAFDFTIPSGATSVSVMLNGVSLSGTDSLLVQLGDSGGVEATGYAGMGASTPNGSAIGVDAYTTGFGIRDKLAANAVSGELTLSLLDSTNHIWVCSGSAAGVGTAQACWTAGSKSLTTELTTVRLTRDGTNTFDAGSVNVAHE